MGEEEEVIEGNKVRVVVEMVGCRVGGRKRESEVSSRVVVG